MKRPTLRQLRQSNRALDALNRCLAVRLWDVSLRLRLTLDHLAGLRKAVTSAYANPADSTRCALIIAEAVLAREAEFLAAWPAKNEQQPNQGAPARATSRGPEP